MKEGPKEASESAGASDVFAVQNEAASELRGSGDHE